MHAEMRSPHEPRLFGGAPPAEASGLQPQRQPLRHMCPGPRRHQCRSAAQARPRPLRHPRRGFLETNSMPSRRTCRNAGSTPAELAFEDMPAAANRIISASRTGVGATRGTSSSKGGGRCGRAAGCSEAGGVASANPSDGNQPGLVASHEASLRRPKPTIEPGRQVQARCPPRRCVPRTPARFT